MLVLCLLVATSAQAAITATALTADAGSTTDGSSFVTASITPTANNLILAWVTNTKASTPPDIPTLSGNGLTWVQVNTVQWGTIATPLYRTTLFRAMGAAPTTGTVTIDFSGVIQTGAAWSIVQFDGVDTSGTNGSGAVRQSVTGRSNSASAGAGLSITLAALGNAANASAGGFSNTVNLATSISAGAGYTVSAGGTYATPNTSIRSEWKTTGSTTVNVTQSGTSHIGGIAVEVKAELCSGNVVTTTADTGSGSLRECINKANANAGTSISFNIATATNQSSGADSWWRITPSTALPTLTANNTVIDATTQTTNQGNTNTKGPEIELFGGSASPASGLSVNAVTGLTLRGLVINSFTGTGTNGNGIYFSGATSQIDIFGSYLGTNATGVSALANNNGLNFQGGTDIDVGGPNAGEGNVISGNSAAGININDSTVVRIRGNIIGLDATGSAGTIPNNQGISILGNGPATNFTIGGAAAGESNLISGNTNTGIGATSLFILGTVNIYGNTIGSGTNGTESFGNGTFGISAINAGSTIGPINIGGITSGQGNLIANNGQRGIDLNGVSGAPIVGNTIKNNGQEGIYSTGSSSMTVIKNVITGNGGVTYDGIRLANSGKIYHNTIHANGGDGIQLDNTSVAIKNNNITGNGGYGINRVAVSMTESNNDVTDNVITPSTIQNALGRSNVVLDVSDINQDPQYVNVAGGNFNLTEPTSPAINAGVDLVADQPDMNGATAGNFNGVAPDMGAFESSTSSTIDISGTCKQLDQTTNCTDTGTVRVAVNGTLQAQTQSTVAGTWTISGVTAPTSGAVITVFVDGAADANEGVAVTKYDGTGNITGVELIEQHLTIGSDDNQTITNADLSQYDNSVSGDEDVFHEVNASNDLTVDTTGALTAEELYIKSGNIFRPDSSTPRNINTHDIEINGTITADGNAFTLGGSWDNNSIFTANTSTVNFTAVSGTELIDSTGATTASLYNLVFNDGGGTATFQLESALSVGNNLTVTDGILDTKSGSNYPINVTNAFSQSGGQVQARASTLTVGGNFSANGTETSTAYNAASIVLTGAGTLSYSNLTDTWDNGFNNLTAGQSGQTTTFTTGQQLGIKGVLTVGSGEVTSGAPATFYLSGAGTPLSLHAAADISIDRLAFFSASPQNIPTLTNGYDTNIVIGRIGLVVTQIGDITIKAGKHLLIQGDDVANRDVTYLTNGFALNVGGNIQIGAGTDTGLKTLNGTGSTITVGGNFEIRTGTNVFTNTSSTVILNGAALQTVTMNGKNFNNLTITNASAAGVSFLDAFTTVNLTDTTAGSKLTFKASTTYTVSGTLTLTGTSGNQIVLLSDTPATRFTLNPGSTQVVSYVNVTDSQTQTFDITANTSTSVSNNDEGEATPHWIFPNIISGTVLIGEGPATVGSGKNVRVLVNGSSVGTAVTGASGNYTLSTPLNANDLILVYVDDNDGNTNDATSVAVSNGGDFIGLNLGTDLVALAYQTAGPMTNALLKSALPGVADTEILYDVPVNDLEISRAGVTLFVGSGYTYTPGSNVTTSLLKINGTMNAGSGTIILTATGAVLTGSGTLVPNTSTFQYTGSGLNTNIAYAPYHHLQLTPTSTTTYFLSGHQSGVATLTGNLIIDGNATLDVTGSNYSIALAGNWSNSGSFSARSGTVTFNGTNQTITGSTTFNNFTKTESTNNATDVTLTFDNTATQTINGLLTLDGLDADDRILLVSNSPSTQWNLTANGTFAIDNVRPTDSDASGGLTILHSATTDGGNNLNWGFTSVISGTVYSDDTELTPLIGKQIRLLINGTDSGLTAATTGSGSYSINATTNAGDVLLVYLDNESEDGSTVTVSNGGALPGLKIYQNHVVVRHDNGGTLTNANLSTATNADGDIRYSVASGNLTVTGSHELFIPANHSFTPGGNVTTLNMESLGTFNGGAVTIDVNNNLLIGGGTFTSTSGTVTIANDLTISGGSFVHNNGTVHFDGTGSSSSVNVGASVFNHVTLSKSGGFNFNLTGTMDIDGNLTINSVGSMTGAITVAGNVTSTDSTVGGTGVITFDGAGAQTLGAGGGGGTAGVPSIVINKAGGTLTLQDTLSVNSDWTHTLGNVDEGTSVVSFNNNASTQSANVSTAAMSFNDVIFDKGGFNITVTGTMDINGNLTISGLSNLNTGTITVAGNVTSTDSTVGGTGVITFDGAGAQTLGAGGGGGTAGVPSIVINKAGGTLTLQDTLSVNRDWTHTLGNVDEGTSVVSFNNNASTQSANVSTAAMSFNDVIFDKGGFNITVTGTMDINGNLTISSVSNLNTGTITVGGNLTSADSNIDGTVAITLDGVGTQNINVTGDLPDGTFTINKVSGAAVLLAGFTTALDGSTQDLHIVQGTFDTASFNVAVPDDLIVAALGIIQLEGGESVTANPIALLSGSTVIYDGGGSYTGLPLGPAYSNLVFNNAAGMWTLSTQIFVSNNLTITNGTLDVSALSFPINVTGNWSNSGTFVPRAGTVIFDGTNQTISGSTTFNNFTKTESTNNAADVTLTFDNTATQTINGLLTLNGLDADDRINLVSNSPGTQWNLTANGTFAIDNVRPTDSDASGGLTILHSATTDGGNNLNWGFTSVISGTVYSDDTELTPLIGKQIRLLINGTDSGLTATTTGSGSYSINATTNAGDVLLVYLDNESEDGSTVTVSNGGALPGLKIYQNHVITRHDNGGTLTNANMSTATNGDPDIRYTVSGGNLTVTGSHELFVPASHSYTPGANITTPSLESRGTFTGGSGAMDINGALTIGGGIYTATSGTMSINSNFTVSSGSYVHNGGTVTIDGASTINIGSEILNHLILNAGNDTIALTGTADLDGNLTLAAANAISGGIYAVAGNVTTTDTVLTSASGTILFDGAGAQVLSAAGGTGLVPSITVNKSAGTLTIQDTIAVRGSATWRHTLGDVVTAGSTVDFRNGDHTIDAVGMTFDNVVFNSDGDITVTGTMDVDGVFTITNANSIDGGTIAVSNNVTTTDSALSGVTGTVLFDGAGAQILSAGGGTGTLPRVTINKASGTLFIQDTINIRGDSWLHSNGDVDAGSSTVGFVQGNHTIDTPGGMSFNHVTFNSDGNNTIVGTMDVDGDLTLSATNSLLGGTITVAGNLSTGDSSMPSNATAAITLDGTGIQTITTPAGNRYPHGILTINKSSGVAQLLTDLILVAGGQDLTITQGALDLNGFNLTVPDVLTVAASGTLQLEGGETVTTTTTTLSSGSTVLYDGSGSYTGLEISNAYSNLTFNGSGTWTLDNALDVNSNLTITNGTLDVSGTNYQINVAGNWSNSGTFTPRSGTVVFDGTNQSLSGSTTFNNFSKTESTNDSTDMTLTFDNTATQTINGTFTLNGLDSDDRINLISNSPGSQWSLVLGASTSKAIDFVDVQDSDASGSNAALIPVSPGNSIDSGNNIQWFAGVTGTVYTDDTEVTPLAGKFVRLLVNGISMGTSTTNASGVYSIPATPTAGQSILVFLDNETEDGTTVSVSGGSSLSGFNLYQNHVVTRHENAGVLTNALMNTATNGDTDIQYLVVSGNLTVTGSHELYIPATHSFTPGGDVTTPSMESLGTFNGGTGTIDINGALRISGGTFTATSGTMLISGGFTISAATFNHNSGLITLDGGAMTANIGTAVLNHVTINKSGTMTVNGDMQINGNLTITAATNINAGDILVAGDVTTNDVQVQGSVGLYFIGSGNQTLSAPGVSGAVPSVFISKPSGILFLQGTIEVDGSQGWHYISGTVNEGTSTVVFDYWSKTIDSVGMSFNHVQISLSAGTVDLTINDTMDINGNLTIISVNNINIGTGLGRISLAGNLITSDVGVGGTVLITLDGTGAQSINTGGMGDLPDGMFTINKASGTASLASNVTLNGAGQDLTITQGTLDLNGFNLTVPDVLTVDASGTLQLEGGETVTRTTVTLNTGSTVLHDGGSSYTGLPLGPSYANLVFNNAAGTWTLSSQIFVNDNLTITTGTFDVSASNYSINVAGNWSNSGTFTPRSGTVIFNGTNQTITGSTTFNNFTKTESTNNATDVTLTFDNTATQTINGLLTLDGLDADDRVLLVSDSPTNQWSLTANGTFTIDNVRPTDSDASGGLTILHSSSTDGGNNLNWGFTPAISGTVYSDDTELSPLIGKQIRLLINGTDSGLTSTTDGSGNYTINALSSAGQTLLVFIDNETENGTTVTVSNGGALPGLKIYQNHVIVRHDNGGTLTNANLSTATNADTDIQYSVASGNLTVTGSHELFIPVSQSFTPGGDITTPSMESRGTFNGGSGIIDINGTLIIGSGSFTATSGTTNIAGHFTISGGSFAHNSGLLTLEGTTKTVNIGNAVLNTVIVNMQDELSDVAVTGTMDVNGNLTISRVGGLLSGTMAVAGNVTTTDMTVSGSATILFDGAGAQAFGSSGGTGGAPSISINKSSGTLNLSDTLIVYADWTHNLGSVSAGTSTVRFEGGTKTINSGSMAFNHVIFNTLDEFQDITVTGTMDINGDFTITRVNNVVGGTITIAGNVTSSDANVSDSAQITLDGTGTQNINVTGDLPDGIFTVNKVSGTAVLLANFTTALDGASQDLTIAQGTLDLNGFNLSIPRILTIAANGILQLEGGETISIPTRAFDTGSTVLYDGGGSYPGLSMGSLYNNLRFNNAAGIWTLSSPLSVLQNLTITNGTLDVSTGNHQVNVGRDWTNSGAFISRSGTVLFNGNTGSQNITGSTTFNNFTKIENTNDGTDLILIFDNTATQTVNGLLTLDGLDADDRINLVSNSPGSQWSLVLGASATKAIDFVDVQDSDASGSASTQKPINPVSSIDSLNNIAWFSAFAVTGTVYQDDRSTPVVGDTVRLIINGADSGLIGVTSGSGTYSINATLNAGDAVLAYVDNGTVDGNTVTITDGVALNGLNIYATDVTVRHDNGGSLTNVHMNTALGGFTDTGDILYSVSGGNLTVNSGMELFILAGHNFTPGGNVTAHDIEINGVLTAGANTLSFNGSWDNNSVFTANTSTVNFTAVSGTELIDSSGAAAADFYNLGFNDGGGTTTFQLESALNVTNDLSVTDGILDTKNGSNYGVTVGRDFLQPGGQVQARASTLTVARHFLVDGTESSTGYNNARLVMTGMGTLAYNNLSNAWLNGVFNLTVGQSGNTITLTSSQMSVMNQFAVGSGSVVGGSASLYLHGGPNPLVVDVNATLDLDQLRFLTALAQNVPPLSNGYDSTIRLAGIGTTLTQTGAITINAGSHLILDGDTMVDRIVTYNTNGFALGVGGNIQIGTGSDTGLKTLNGTNSSITVGGNFEVRSIGSGTQQAVFISNNSTVILNGAADQTITASGSNFNHLTLNNTGVAGSDDIIISGALDVNGNLTITNGDLDIGTNNPTVNTAGNVTFSINGSTDSTGRTATWIFDGTSIYRDISGGIGGQDLKDVVITGTVNLNDIELNVRTMNVTSTGTLNLGNGAYRLRISGTGTPFTMAGTLLLPGASIVEYSGTGSATNITHVPYRDLWLTPTAATTFSLTGHQTGGNALTGNLSIGSNATLNATVSSFGLTTVFIGINGTYMAQGSTITVSGNWTNTGTFAAGTSTVILNGINQNITGSTTFNNFTKTESTNDATDAILTFDNTSTQTINGLLTLDGLDADDRINLVSNSLGNQWSLLLGTSSTKSIDFVDVRDSDASGSDSALIPVNPVNSIDSGNNIQWFATAVAATSTLVEISPNLVAVGSMGNAFTYDLLPTIGGSDTGIDQVAVTVPPGYANLSVTAVSVGGTNQAAGASCPAIGGGEYCAVTAGQVMTVTLGGKVTTTLTNIRIAFTSDVPGTVGSADFTSTIDDRGSGIAAQAATVGNADGDGTDNNSITVQVIGRAVTSVSGEISPNAVPISSISNIYTYDVLPTINPGDTGFDQLAITAPAGHSNFSITGLSVGGTSQTLGVSCPTPGAGEYCVNTAAQVMTLTFGTPVTTSLTPIRLTFSADAPSTVGSGDFTTMVDDTGTMTAAQTAAAGNADGDTGDANSMTVATGDLAATSATAEISPNTVVMSTSAAAFTLDLLPTINPADTGIDQIVVTAPAGFANLSVTGLSIGGANQAAGISCPTVAAGEYCAGVSGPVLTLSLGNKIMASLTNIQVRFSADVPGTAGNVNFAAIFNDTATTVVAPQSAIAGDADGDAGDANSLSVTVRTVDGGQSSVSATPSLVEIDYESDGNPFSTIVIVPRDAAGVNLGANLNIVVSASETAPPSRKPAGLNHAPGDPFGVLTAVVDNGDGTYSTRLSSSIAGIAALAVTVNGVALQSLEAVTFTAGQVLKINKTVNKKSGVVGDVITYEVEIQNTANLDISSVTLNDKIPAGFKYLRGSTLLNAQPAADPSGHQILAFNLGTIAAWTDQNGNGLPDAGDLGNLTLSYQLVIGSGVKPDDHVNRAQAVDFAPISNEAEAKVRVSYDPLFDLGTLIGKVFFDKNKNGWQDAGESGVSGVMIALDNGTYVLTDNNGLYHFPGVLPGQRLLKINVATLPPGTTITTEESRIVEVSRGLLSKVNFGVVYDIETEHIGRPGKQGAALSPTAELEPSRITGYLEPMQILVNGSDVDISLNDVHLGREDLEETVEVVGEKLSRPMSFSVLLNAPELVKSWRLDVFDPEGKIFKSVNAAGPPPETILWDGKNDGLELVAGGGIYAYQVEIIYEDGGRETSSRRLFGVNKTSAISLNLLGSAFSLGSAQINAKTEKVLHELAEVLKQHPDEKITIEGHTDDTGTETLNLNLSRQRAEAAMDYLVEKEGIARNRFVLKWFGESRPVMSNTLPEGREVNRRVEIVGSLKEVKKAKILNHPRSETVVVVNSLPMQADAAGRFSMVLPEDTNTLAFEISNPQGRLVQTTLSFPSVEILSPAPDEVLVFGQRTDRYLAIPFQGLGSRPLDLPVASYRIQGKTEGGNLVWMDGKAVKVSPQGLFENDLLLKIGENIFTIVVSNPQQVSRMMTLRLQLSDKDDQGRLFMAIKPIPQISVLLPPKEKVLSHTQLPLRGMTDRGNRLWVNQKEILVEESGTFSTTAELLEGRNTLIIEAADPDGYTSRIEREVIVEKAPFFLMALADGEFGQMKTSGRLEGAGADEATEYYSKGRLAYYLKGRILGKYLITSAFDTGKNEFDRMFNDLDQKETDRFFTNIDPDKFYPVYGDESTVVYDVQSQGKFYLAIDGEDLNVLVGNYQTQLNDTELGAFNRTLHGGRFEYRSLSKTQYGAHDTKVVLFGAQVRLSHGQNTFHATGGSLYYLSEKNIVEGSEQVRLEVRDQDTGLILAKIDQVRDADYSFKYEEGRILFRRPISSVVSNDLLLRQVSLQGHPVFVQVDFEYEAQGFDKKTVGGRLRQQVGDHLAVGGTAIQDAADGGDYELTAADAEIRLGERTILAVEYAESAGKNSTNLISEDGGLSFIPIASASADEGDAYKLAVRSDLSEWFGEKERLVGNAYYKELSPEFFSNGTLLEQGTLKYGGALLTVLNERNILHFRYDVQEVIPNANPVSANRVGAAQVIVKEIQYDHRRGPLLFTAGFQDKRIDDTKIGEEAEQQLAGRVDWQVNERISTSLGHQQLIRGEERYRTAAGLKVRLAEWLDTVAEGAQANDRHTALVGFSARIDDRSTLYTNETLEKKQGEAATWGNVVGGDRMLTQRLRLYGEYGEQRGNVDQSRSLWGLDQRFGDDQALKINLNYERSHLKGVSLNTTRDAAGVGLRYLRPDGSRSAHRFEVRLERGADKKIQRLSTHYGELKLISGLTIFGKFNFSDTKNRSQDRLDARFTEAGVGGAYRPIAFDRLNLITKYTFLMDQRPETSGPMLKTEAHVTSLEAVYDLSRHVQWVEKYAVKIKEETQSPRPRLNSQTDLWINRFNFHITQSWDISGEYRILKQSQAKDQLEGYAVEINKAVAAHFRFGVGYNFSRFTDNEFSDNNYDARGWFIRAQGKY